MEPAKTIRNAVATVNALRMEADASPLLLEAVMQIKRFQENRFRATYADLLASDDYGPASQFFLNELYSDKDFAQRDAQFAKIAGALQTLLPKQLVHTAVVMAQLHRLTEELDHQMGIASLSRIDADLTVIYAQAWKKVGRPADRQLQLKTVLSVGMELERLTRTPGLRLMLKMMRKPAHAAGLGALQQFLEAGFDTFAGMSSQKHLVKSFLLTVEQRETKYIDWLFSADAFQLTK